MSLLEGYQKILDKGTGRKIRHPSMPANAYIKCGTTNVVYFDGSDPGNWAPSDNDITRTDYVEVA